MLRLAAAASLLASAAAQFGMGGFGGPPETFEPLRRDLKHIRCDVCRAAGRELHAQAEAAHVAAKETNGYERAEEHELHDVVDNVCDKDTQPWLARQDIFTDDDGFTAVRDMGPGRCRRECTTVARSCHDTLDEHDLEDVVVALWRREADAEAVAALLCEEATDACARPRRVPKKPRQDDEEFEAMSDEDAQLEELMRQLRMGGGNPGIVNPEDMMGMYDDAYGDDFDMAAYDDGFDYGDLYGDAPDL